jgi:hypothetical protein
MKVAVMQPYVFPYIGYFQLLNAVDTFIFYDDVQFIKGGWVNRNRILVNSKDLFLTLPCLNKSSNKKINEIYVNKQTKDFLNLLTTLKMAYSKAPYFNFVYPMLVQIFESNFETISQLAINSIISVCEYLDIKVNFKVSSQDFPQTFGLNRSDRLIEMCKMCGVDHYINPIGGKELYDKTYFIRQGIKLEFLKSNISKYSQFSNVFIPALSIIDVLMFNSIEESLNMINNIEIL